VTVPEALSRYRFSVGQKVVISATGSDRLPAGGTFRITARLPLEQGEYQYRVQHDREAFERRVGENRLTPVR
jgi:hypothetical protein